MDPWSIVEELFHAARDLPAGQRGQYLREACGDDGELRAEVEGLLDQAACDSFLEGSPLSSIQPPPPAGAAGQTTGHFRIVKLIGRGGMGEVYQARDLKLKRDVALKILPEAFASDRDRMARFQREAEVLASLNHPNIAQIYGMEDHALVMELVEGTMLAGPLPLSTALTYARQIADALGYAHEKGVVHRDLKPANLKITPEGIVKVLDFGLAKVAGKLAPAGSSSESLNPTQTATQAGVIIGTAAYMSPEQASGRPVDQRTDVWSFGVVLWEMLTGTRVFQGDSTADTLANVLRATRVQQAS